MHPSSKSSEAFGTIDESSSSAQRTVICKIIVFFRIRVSDYFWLFLFVHGTWNDGVYCVLMMLDFVDDYYDNLQDSAQDQSRTGGQRLSIYEHSMSLLKHLG